MTTTDGADAERDALICLTAFDVLWALMPQSACDAVDEEMDDNAREVVQRAVEMSVARRLAEGMV